MSAPSAVQPVLLLGAVYLCRSWVVKLLRCGAPDAKILRAEHEECDERAPDHDAKADTDAMQQVSHLISPGRWGGGAIASVPPTARSNRRPILGGNSTNWRSRVRRHKAISKQPSHPSAPSQS